MRRLIPLPWMCISLMWRMWWYGSSSFHIIKNWISLDYGLLVEQLQTTIEKTGESVMTGTVSCSTLHVPHFFYIQVVHERHEKQTKGLKMSYQTIGNPGSTAKNERLIPWIKTRPSPNFTQIWIWILTANKLTNKRQKNLLSWHCNFNTDLMPPTDGLFLSSTMRVNSVCTGSRFKLLFLAVFVSSSAPQLYRITRTVCGSPLTYFCFCFMLSLCDVSFF